TVSRYLGHEFSPEIARTLLSDSGMTIDDVIERWRGGDERAQWALRETARYLAAGLATIVNAINPAIIFVGGEVTAAWELFAPKIANAIRARALSPAAANTRVVPEAPGSHPRLLGATALVAAPGFAAPIVA
nr:ROK family protein [Gemmatimonadota bacterium]